LKVDTKNESEKASLIKNNIDRVTLFVNNMFIVKLFIIVRCCWNL